MTEELRKRRFSWEEGDLIPATCRATAPGEEKGQSQKVRNWLVDDDLNRDWMKMYLRLSKGTKAGSFITDDEGRVLFIGGPGSGGGSLRAQYVLPGVELDKWAHAVRFPEHGGDEEQYGTETWRDQLQNLTEGESNAIMTYTQSAYDAINANMRYEQYEQYEDNADMEIAARDWASRVGYSEEEIEDNLGEILSDYGTHMISSLDSALEKSRVPEDLVVWRGLREEGFIFGTEEGKMFTDPAYMSTTLSPEVAKRFGDTLVEIRVPAGAKGLYLNGKSDVPRELEVLFGRDTALRMVERGEKHYIVEVVP